jgi:hypothetical protein
LYSTGDEIVPFWQEWLYGARVDAAGSRANVSQLPVFRYGHCNFTTGEGLLGLGLLALKVAGGER